MTGILQPDPDWVVTLERTGLAPQDIVPTADGGFYIAGVFVEVDGHRTDGLVKIRADGSVDTAFAVDFDEYTSIRSIALQDDAKLVVAGDFKVSANAMEWEGLARLNPDGSVDTEFVGGRNDVSSRIYVRELAIAPDGDIFALGTLRPTVSESHTLGRFTPDGVLQSTFARQLTKDGSDVSATGIAVLGTDRLVVAGNFARVDDQVRSLVAVLDLNGQMVPGEQVELRGDVTNTNVVQVVRDGNGDVLVGFVPRSLPSEIDYPSVAKLYANGDPATVKVKQGSPLRTIAPDGAGGVWTGSTTGEDVIFQHLDGALEPTDSGITVPSRQLWTMARLADGSIAFGGNGSYNGLIRSDFTVVDSGGGIRPEFDSTFRSPAPANTVLALPDGSIIVGGDFASVNGIERPYLARITAMGQVDASFPFGGAAPNGVVTHVVSRTDGKLYLAGAFSAFGSEAVEPVVRLESDGRLDREFSLSSRVPVGGSQTSLAVAPDGGVFVGGWFWDSVLGGGPGVVKFLPSGFQDINFVLTINGKFSHQNAVYSMVRSPDGGFYMGSYNRFARLHSNGATELAFGASVADLSAVSDIVVTGNTILVAHSEGIDRLDFTGDPIQGQGLHGFDFWWGANGPLGRIFPDTQGGVIIAGHMRLNSGPGQVPRNIMRLDADGIVDESVWLARNVTTFIAAIDQLPTGQLVYSVSGEVRRTVGFVPTSPEVLEPFSDVTVDEDAPLELSVTAVGEGDLSYQWRKDGVNIVGATSAKLDFGQSKPSDSGRYNVVVTNLVGSVTSEEIWVTVEAHEPVLRALLNMSTRIRLAGSAKAYAPFRIQGDGTKLVLLRAVGPSLRSLGVTGVMTDPALRLLDATGTEIARVDAWAGDSNNASAVTNATTLTGAFSLDSSSKDAATVALLGAGHYILEVSGPDAGIVLVEIYDADDAPSTTRLVHAGFGADFTNGGSFVSGFVVDSSDEATRNFVFRAVGPGLSVPDSLANPDLTLRQQTTQLAYNDQWYVGSTSVIMNAMQSVGAPAFLDYSYDAATVQDLSGGIYTLEFGSIDGGSGIGLLEIYDAEGIVPPELPYLLIPPTEDTVIVGETLEVGVYAGGEEPLTYQWQREGDDIPGATAALLTIPAVTLGDAGDYRVVITNTHGSITTAPATITVDPPPTAPEITAEPISVTIASGSSATFMVTASGTEPISYQWYQGSRSVTDNPITGATGASFTTDALSTSTSYWVRVSNSVGAADSIALEATVQEPSTTTASHAIVGRGYLPGMGVAITNTFHYEGTEVAIGWSVQLPDGWSFASVGGDSIPQNVPAVGATGTLEFTYDAPPASGSSFRYMLSVPEGTLGNHAVSALLRFTPTGQSETTVTATPGPLTIAPRESRHSADTNGDFLLSLSELLRVIELYNTRFGTARTGRYRLHASSADGFEPDATANGPATLTRYHTADTDRDGQLSLSELLRVIEIYNTRSGTTRTGAYRPASGTADGFEPGQAL